MQEFFNLEFPIGPFDLTLRGLLLGLLVAGIWAGVHYGLMRLAFRHWLEGAPYKAHRRKLKRLTGLFFFTLMVLAIFLGSGMSLEFYRGFGLTEILQALLIWEAARMIDLTFSLILTRRIIRQEEEEGKGVPDRSGTLRSSASRIVQSVVYVLAIFYLLRTFPALDPNLLPSGTEVNDESLDLHVSNIVNLLLIILIARLLVWVSVHLFLESYYRNREVDPGSRYAINQLFKYVVYTIAVITGLQMIGLNLTLIWGGAAALLVGVGLGLQQTFNDLFSGIVLLTERSVEVGDVVDLQGLVGTVRRIGIRTSEVQTRENIMVLVPNSKLIVENVVNWSHNDKKARFEVNVGVAYGSDTQLVKEILLRAARSHKSVLGYPSPFVRFVDFGNSSLDFKLLFFSREFITIENVKSDLRFEIDRLFRENGVTIPFPQRDVWFRNPMLPPGTDNGAAPKEEEREQEKTEGKSAAKRSAED